MPASPVNTAELLALPERFRVMRLIQIWRCRRNGCLLYRARSLPLASGDVGGRATKTRRSRRAAPPRASLPALDDRSTCPDRVSGRCLDAVRTGERTLSMVTERAVMPRRPAGAYP